MDNEVVLIEEPGGLAASSAEPVVVVDEDADATKLPPQAKPQPDGSVLLPLRFPVTLKYRSARSDAVKEDRVEELVLHRMMGSDMRAIQAASASSQSVVALARSTRIPEAKFNAIYDRMDAGDIDAASQVIMHFLQNGRPTGR